MAIQAPPKNWWQLMRQNIPWRQFIIGGLIPIGLFYLFHRLRNPLLGAVLAAGWGTSIAIITYLFFERVNLFAVLAVPFCLIELTGIIITFNPKFYLIWPVIHNALWGLIFIGSVLISLPLILVFAQAMGSFPKNEELGEFGKSKLFRSTWIIITLIWGMAHLVGAGLILASLIWLPLEVYLTIRMVTGVPLNFLLLAFSFWFPMWYWKKAA